MRAILDKLRKSRLNNLRALAGAPLAYTPGHFYSAICDVTEVMRRYHDPDSVTIPHSIQGIAIAHDAHVALWESWKPFFPAIEQLIDNGPNKRYRLPSPAYSVGDATIYAAMLNNLRPSRIIEVGSGWSSALLLDFIDQFFADCPPRLSFIEPFPKLVKSFLKPSDKGTEILASPVQDVPLTFFDGLQENDIVFIDSTHVVKTGSDVVFEVFEILPRLRPGVVVHFHDCFYPFEYPKRWVLDLNYSWNELYFLRAFLTDNRSWEIIFFNDYFAKTERERVARDAPRVLENPGGGLWLRRV